MAERSKYILLPKKCETSPNVLFKNTNLNKINNLHSNFFLIWFNQLNVNISIGVSWLYEFITSGDSWTLSLRSMGFDFCNSVTAGKLMCFISTTLCWILLFLSSCAQECEQHSRLSRVQFVSRSSPSLHWSTGLKFRNRYLCNVATFVFL